MKIITVSIITWIDVIKAPLASDMISCNIPRALIYYDLPDLIKAIFPRTVHVNDAVDAYGNLKSSTEN